MHRLLVPVDASLRAVDALRYIVEHFDDHVSGVHVVNVQRPVMSGDMGVLARAHGVIELRQEVGQGILALARRRRLPRPWRCEPAAGCACVGESGERVAAFVESLLRRDLRARHRSSSHGSARSSG
jgi:hypothetical protein